MVPFFVFLRHLLGYLRVKLSSGFAEYLPLLAGNSARRGASVHLCLFFFFPFIYQVTYQVKVLGVEADAGSNRRKQSGHEWRMAEAGLGV